MERGAMARIPRFSVSQITTIGRAFEVDLAAFVAAGVPAVGVSIHKLERCGVARGLRLLRDSGLPVSCVTSAGPVPLDDEAAAGRRPGAGPSARAPRPGAGRPRG
jgi:hypothetical protein